MSTMMDTDAAVDRSMLTEMLHWVKTLNTAGVSPDKAAEVSRDFLMAACSDDEEDYEEGCDEG